MLNFTEKQWEVLLAPLPRLNVIEGSVRSGKTFISLFMWSNFVASMPKSSEFIMIGKTLTSLKRNILELLIQIVEEANFTYSSSQKKSLESYNNKKSEESV